MENSFNKRIGLIFVIVALASVPLYSAFWSSKKDTSSTPSSPKKSSGFEGFFSGAFSKAKGLAESGAGAAVLQKAKGTAVGLAQKTKLGRKLLGAPEQPAQQAAVAPKPQAVAPSVAVATLSVASITPATSAVGDAPDIDDAPVGDVAPEGDVTPVGDVASDGDVAPEGDDAS